MNKNLIKQKIQEINSRYEIKDKNTHLKILCEIAQLRGGKVKSNEQYINNKTKIIFIDKLGNEFKMAPSNIKSGHWSPFESQTVRNTEYHFKKLEKIALSKGGSIKDGQIYINANTKMTFIDKLGNEFKMVPTAVKSGSWSPFESGNVYDSEYHFKELEKIALAKGGKIKDGQIYINTITKMIFIDQLGNEFKMTPASVKIGQWSPFEKNYCEHICRQIIEQIYNEKFPSVWDILKRKNKNKLQLDGYCKELNIAFEYQGIQHSIGWGNDEDKRNKSLVEILKRDKEKKYECEKNNILLLEINYYRSITNIEDLIKQTIEDIKNSYSKLKINIPNFILDIDLKKINIDFSQISHLSLMQKELERIALAKGGRIKDHEQYIGAHTKITFIDRLGNEFKMTPASIKRGSWSPFESGNIYDSKYHFKELEKIALAKGGRIKDGEQYIGAHTKITFIDKLGNEFKMTPTCVKRGQWSPFESKTVRNPKHHFKELEKIALSKGGEIKEGEQYINNRSKITFIDRLGNEFKMTPTHVKRGQWSPYESKSFSKN